jgi:spermidine synthase
MTSGTVSSSSRSSSKVRKPDVAADSLSVERANASREVFLPALALSGFAALVYQVLWVRQLSLVVGLEVYSITIAVSAFFAGLAGGAAVFGRVADRVGSPAKLYAALEATIAVLGVAVTLLLPHASMPFVWLREHMNLLAWLLPFVLVGVPAFAMGGTLPLAVRALRAGGEAAAVEGGLLYAANTVGGIVGALAASFALIPWFGLRGSGMAAAVLNLAAGALVWMRAAREENVTTSDINGIFTAKTANDACESEAIAWAPLALYAVAGGIALGYEVVWTQAIGQFVSTRSFAFSIVLAVYLAGLALGSWTAARTLGRMRDLWGIFGMLIVAAGLVAILEFAVMGPWIVKLQTALSSAAGAATGSQAMRMYASFAVASLGMVFVPTVLLGAAFPIALRLTVGAKSVGRDIGEIVAVNTAGGILGTLLTGFVLVPALGLVRSLSLLAIAAAVVGLVSVLLGTGVSRTLKWCAGMAAVTIAIAGILTPADQLAKLLLATRGGGALVFYEEGRGATVAVAQQRSKDNVFRRLFIQGVSNSGDAMPSMRYMRLQAMLPLLLHHGEPRRVMVVGFGTGITAGETLRYPGLEKRVCAELLPAVIRSGQMFPENYGAWKDSRMEIRVRDGRQELMRSDERYDVITLEPPPPSAQGVANLYSTEFYELARKRLGENGLFAQWLPIATQNETETRELVRSFLDAFPYATLWTTELHEMLLVGSETPIRLDASAMARRFASETVVASMKAVGVGSPGAVMATWMMGRKELEKFAGAAKVVTDDRPRVEYGSWVRPNEITRVLPQLMALQTLVPVEGADSALQSEIAMRHGTLMNFYIAGLAAYEGDRETWAEAMGKVQVAEPKNAYYSWIAGRD